MIGVVLIVGAIYYFAVQRKKPYEPVVPPDEDLTGIVAGGVGLDAELGAVASRPPLAATGGSLPT